MLLAIFNSSISKYSRACNEWMGWSGGAMASFRRRQCNTAFTLSGRLGNVSRASKKWLLRTTLQSCLSGWWDGINGFWRHFSYLHMRLVIDEKMILWLSRQICFFYIVLSNVNHIFLNHKMSIMCHLNPPESIKRLWRIRACDFFCIDRARFWQRSERGKENEEKENSLSKN